MKTSNTKFGKATKAGAVIALSLSLAVSVSAASIKKDRGSEFPSCNTGFDLKSFVVKNFPERPDVKPVDVKIIAKKETGIPGWCLYRFAIKFNQKGKEILSVPTNFIVNTQKGIGAFDFISLKNGKNLSETLFSKVNKDMEDSGHLVAGSQGAEHRVVIFSDPVCPYCKKTVPQVVSFAKKHPEKLAVYLYHYPLSGIHPSASTVAAGLSAALKKTQDSSLRSDLVLGIYGTKSNLSSRKFANPGVMASYISHNFKIPITAEEIASAQKEISSDMKKGDEAGITQTPTFYFDEEKDFGGRRLFQFIDAATMAEEMSK